ncbi:MAG: MotA/TolQ/ExbB proton channel family protein [Deltaproteobacteria bacterium]|nr:MotA/TolQ/ExbB proton channel family protein [Deltaproteobacteria bacterium]
MTDSLTPAAGFVHRDLAEARRDSLIAGWFAALAEGDAASHRYLLLLRYAVLNLVALALLGAAWIKGWVPAVLAGDTTGLVLLIGAVFLFGLLSCGRKIWQTSVDINQLKEGRCGPGTRVGRYLESVQGRDGHTRALAASALKLKLGARIASIRHVANSLVFLGLIGTVIGFIIALSGVNAQTAADVDAIGPMVSTLIGGMSVALYTTLVGAVLNIWLMTNYRLLEGGSVTLITAIVEEGERREHA